MGIVRDLYMARKMSAGVNIPAPSVAQYIKRRRLAGAGSAEYEGDIVEFDTPSARKLKELTIYLEPFQEGTGDPAPDNVRPIHGYTGTSAWRTGKNFLSKDALVWKDGYARNDSGTDIVSDSVGYSNAIPVLPSTQYTYSMAPAPDSVRIYFLTEDGSWISRTAGQYSVPFTFTTPATCKKIQIQTQMNKYKAVNFEPCLFAGTGEVEPFVGTQYAVEFPAGQTIYSGTVDLVTGSGVIDMAKVEFSGANGESWAFSAGSGKNRVYIEPAGVVTGTGYRLDIYGNYVSAPSEAMSSPDVWKCNINNNGVLLIGIPTEIDSVASWRTYLASNNLDIVYPLAQKIEIQLTPQEIQTLNDHNVIWSPDGPVKVRV